MSNGQIVFDAITDSLGINARWDDLTFSIKSFWDYAADEHLRLIADSTIHSANFQQLFADMRKSSQVPWGIPVRQSRGFYSERVKYLEKELAEINERSGKLAPLVKKYENEHPKDESIPIDEEWIYSEFGSCLRSTNGNRVDIENQGGGEFAAYLYSSVPQTMATSDGIERFLICHVETRGQLRSLFRLMGIKNADEYDSE